MAISPSGRLLAIDFTKGEQRTIIVQDLVARKAIAGIKVGEVKVRQMEWAGDDHLLITSSATSGILGTLSSRAEWYLASDLNIPAKRFTPLLADLPDMSGANVIFDFPTVRTIAGKTTVFVSGVHFDADSSGASLYRIALDTDRSNLVAVGDTLARNFVIGVDGKVLAEDEYNPIANTWGVKVFPNGVPKEVQDRKVGIEGPGLDGLGRDGRSILIEDHEGGVDTLRELSPDGAALSDPLPVEHWDDLIRDPATDRLIGTVALVGDELRYNYFDPKGRKATHYEDMTVDVQPDPKRSQRPGGVGRGRGGVSRRPGEPGFQLR